MQNVSNHQIIDDPEYESYLNKRKAEVEVENQKSLQSTQLILNNTQYILFNTLASRNSITVNDLKSIASSKMISRNINLTLDDIIRFKDEATSNTLKSNLDDFIKIHKNSKIIKQDDFQMLFKNDEFKTYFKDVGFQSLIKDFKINNKRIRLKAIDLDSIITNNKNISDDLIRKIKVIRKGYGYSLNSYIKNKHIKDLIKNQEFISLVAKQKFPAYINYFNNNKISDSLIKKLNNTINSSNSISNKSISTHKMKSLIMDDEFRNLLRVDVQDTIINKLNRKSKKISFKIGEYFRKSKIGKWWENSTIKKLFVNIKLFTNKTIMFFPNLLMKSYLKSKKALSLIFKPILKPLKFIGKSLLSPLRILALPFKLPIKAFNWMVRNLVYKPMNWLFSRLITGTKRLLLGIFKLLKNIIKFPFVLTIQALKYLSSKLTKTKISQMIGESFRTIGNHITIFSKKIYGKFMEKVKSWWSNSRLKNFSKRLNIFSQIFSKMFGWLMALFSSVFSSVIIAVVIIIIVIGAIWFLGYEDIRVPHSNYKNNYNSSLALSPEDKDLLDNLITEYNQKYGITVSLNDVENICYAVKDLELLIDNKLSDNQEGELRHILSLYVITTYDKNNNVVYTQRDKSEVIEMLYTELKGLDQTNLLTEYETDFKSNFSKLANEGSH
ncbi:hypothetical protein KHQ81_15495 (plasmid) [Mycoplasmatota bacterium]|nr:hypothetical protein KHQ81_15495 [Mycoplasmatota bacterium]